MTVPEQPNETCTASAPPPATADKATTAQLATFLAGVKPQDLAPAVLERTTELFLDWLGCCLAGTQSEPVLKIARFAASLGDGQADVLPGERKGSAYQAAFANAASSHMVEQDDLHNASVVHPATVVFPAALAAAQELGRSGLDFLTAAVVGYEAATRVGAYLGPSHYRVFHTTGTAGTLGAAAAVAHLLGASAEQMTDALGNAGTTAAGLWQFLSDSADSKPLHAAHAAATGLAAAYLAHEGLKGATRVIEGERGMGAAMSQETMPAALHAGLGTEWAVMNTSLKVHASCRHTHPAADALTELLNEHGLKAADIERVTVGVYQAAKDVLEAATVPITTHQAKFSMGFVLALIAHRGRAGVLDFDADSITDQQLLEFAARVEMHVDDEIEKLHPQRWAAQVTLLLKDGTRTERTVESPRGDPDRWLTASELNEKFRTLANYPGTLNGAAVEQLIGAARSVSSRGDLQSIMDWKPTR